ncbi:MAG: serine acetyltransferase [Clostridia bacterium]|nr:serine acetyltransferase [Clostridia bacterium]
MEKTLALLVEQTGRELECVEAELWPTVLDYVGFRRHAELLTEHLVQAMFPRHASVEVSRQDELAEALRHLGICLTQLNLISPGPEDVMQVLLHKLPVVRRQLQKDLEAAYIGDPAARSLDEIILCYPAFTAISAYRLAHIFYGEGVPLLPRAMTEYAHRLTGIDIHPGAQIGESFFIDHGTGVVIGETTTIGKNVKLYQHVTLGAKSFDVGDDGTLVKGIKRHPDIGDRVVIYAGATILGGNTQIGNDCVIGGNVWLTHSVSAGKKVLARATVLDAPLTEDLELEPSYDDAQ